MTNNILSIIGFSFSNIKQQSAFVKGRAFATTGIKGIQCDRLSGVVEKSKLQLHRVDIFYHSIYRQATGYMICPF
jgi:hypothetical protein